ncbi:hypothetical protein Bca52824_075390 [Brassica carinata]|uniref:Uncharacterized protein n=1 Tax=Brassica carinata TaxID=52824 RepID=A0A8X7TWH3_BRACI|nr:hypothetical protein Bca52824_075390 [Brassica carinata]
MKNGEMKQSKKLLKDIAEIAGNCLTVCPSQEGGILRQCPRESPLANGQILIDGQVLIRLMADSMTNRRVQVVNGDAHVSVFGDILIQEGQLVRRAKVYHGFNVEAYAGLKKIMKELQAWLKVELREVRRDKRRQRDAEDEQACSKHQERSAQSKGYGLGPNRWSFVRSSVDTKKEKSRQRSLSVAKAKSLGGRSLKHPGSASMASLGEIE